LLQKGDVVRIIMPGEDVDGLLGEVAEINEEQLWPVKVHIHAPGYGSLTWVFFEDELEKIDD
jgi:hypothetical protein